MPLTKEARIRRASKWRRQAYCWQRSSCQEPRDDAFEDPDDVDQEVGVKDSTVMAF